MQRSLAGGVAPAGRRAAVPAQRSDFSWDVARSWLDGQPGGGLNIAHEAVDRHAAGAHASRTALHDSTGIDVPEADYPRVESLTELVHYLVAHSERTAVS
jgi:hypothetical protein